MDGWYEVAGTLQSLELLLELLLESLLTLLADAVYPLLLWTVLEELEFDEDELDVTTVLG